MVAAAGQSGFDQEHAEFVAVQTGGVRLVVQLRATHMHRWRHRNQLFFAADDSRFERTSVSRQDPSPSTYRSPQMTISRTPFRADPACGSGECVGEVRRGRAPNARPRAAGE